VFGRGNKEEKGEWQDDVLAFSQFLEQLEKEIQTLSSEKEHFLDSERLLLHLIKEEIEVKKRENQALRSEVEKQKEKCVKIANAFNASVKASYSIP